jgi:hypothetical protein
MKNKKQDPYNVQLADLANELGGNMAVEYYNVSFTLTKEQLLDMKNKGLRTDIMSCIMAALIMNGKNEAEIKAFLEEAHQAGVAPSVTFEAPDDGALNVTSPEENPELDKLVKAMGI